MKGSILSILMILFLGMGLTAQEEERKSQEEMDMDALRSEMQEKMDAMKAEMEEAMQQMQSYMQELEFNSLNGKNEIIINGDTLIITNEDLPDNLLGFGDMFNQVPEDMEGLNFFFGGPEMEDLMGKMEDFQGDFFNLDQFLQLPDSEDRPEFKEDEDSDTKKTKPTKKRKTYSL